MKIELTKKDFWTPLYKRYPIVKIFYDWIDEYKKRDENRLFFTCENEGWGIKFHDMPVAVQWGVFQQFCAEQFPSGFGGIESSFEHPNDIAKIPELITEYFAEMQDNAETEHREANYGQ